MDGLFYKVLFDVRTSFFDVRPCCPGLRRPSQDCAVSKRQSWITVLVLLVSVTNSVSLELAGSIGLRL